jgi:hypothetical protein
LVDVWRTAREAFAEEMPRSLSLSTSIGAGPRRWPAPCLVVTPTLSPTAVNGQGRGSRCR